VLSNKKPFVHSATFANSFFSASYFSFIQSPSQISSRTTMHQLT